MNHLPQLSIGVQRAAGVGGAKLAHGVAAAQPIYGKYCGAGHGDGGAGCIPADDEVDAACCRHDACYDQRGYFNCGCDCDLVKSMPSAIANTPSELGKAAGAAAMAFFAISPCFHYIEVCPPFVGCFTVPIPNLGPTKCLFA